MILNMSSCTIFIHHFLTLLLLSSAGNVEAFSVHSKSSKIGFTKKSARSDNTLLWCSDERFVDVSDLGLTMDDLNEPLPPELLQGIKSSGYESTSRVSTSVDRGCAWKEDLKSFDVTLTIPGLRGQPAGCLAVEFANTTISVTAFGMVVWSCLLRGPILPDSAIFKVQEGDDMTPVIQLTVEKANNVEQRWGGFIDQIGENSIL